ncbi:unnamed protein product [Schistocephalus solidus]|uniref:Uncharacterized protein n=1 Tax=Schistocephalus solidus TaxID=70667 RepID=A0A183T5G7_SCHSO|nr:unnamed protein product [Schistocephalus solidus]
MERSRAHLSLPPPPPIPTPTVSPRSPSVQLWPPGASSQLPNRHQRGRRTRTSTAGTLETRMMPSTAGARVGGGGGGAQSRLRACIHASCARELALAPCVERSIGPLPFLLLCHLLIRPLSTCAHSEHWHWRPSLLVPRTL